MKLTELTFYGIVYTSLVENQTSWEHDAIGLKYFIKRDASLVGARLFDNDENDTNHNIYTETSERRHQ